MRCGASPLRRGREASVASAWAGDSARERLLGRLLGTDPPPALAPGGDSLAPDPDFGLAVRAHLPHGIQRPAAVVAGVLELAHAVRAAQELTLHLVVAVRAQVVPQLGQPRLRGL